MRWGVVLIFVTYGSSKCHRCIAKSDCYRTPRNIILFCRHNWPRGRFVLWGVLCVMVNALDLIVYHTATYDTGDRSMRTIKSIIFRLLQLNQTSGRISIECSGQIIRFVVNAMNVDRSDVNTQVDNNWIGRKNTTIGNSSWGSKSSLVKWNAMDQLSEQL